MFTRLAKKVLIRIQQKHTYQPSSHGNVELGKNYTSSTPILNIDTRALSERAQGRFYGYIKKNSKIVGKESNATAFVKGNVRLITDVFGGIIGTFFVENPYSLPTPELRFKTDLLEFTVLTTSKNNVKNLPGQSTIVEAIKV